MLCKMVFRIKSWRFIEINKNELNSFLPELTAKRPGNLKNQGFPVF